MNNGIPIIGLHTKTGKALLALVLPHIQNGAIHIGPGQHYGLCEILNKYYPKAAGESHKGDFVFGMPIIVGPLNLAGVTP